MIQTVKTDTATILGRRRENMVGWIDVCMDVYIYIYIYIYLSLSLYIYIYIYTHTPGDVKTWLE